MYVRDTVCVDLSLNPNVGSNTISILADITRPNVTLSTGAWYNPAGVDVYPYLRAERDTPVRITMTFNEPVTNFDLSDFTVSNGVMTSLNTTGDGCAYPMGGVR